MKYIHKYKVGALYFMKYSINFKYKKRPSFIGNYCNFSFSFSHYRVSEHKHILHSILFQVAVEVKMDKKSLNTFSIEKIKFAYKIRSDCTLQIRMHLRKLEINKQKWTNKWFP